MEARAKKLYDSLLKSGELLDMFPHFEGDWREDREEFNQMYELNKNLFI
jgi:hypothetical protein